MARISIGASEFKIEIVRAENVKTWAAAVGAFAGSTAGFMPPAPIAGQRRRLAHLFDYSEYSRQWHVNAACYPDAESALQWLKSDGPSLNEWAVIVQDYRAQAYARMRRIRS